MKTFWSYSVAIEFNISGPLELQDQFISFWPRGIRIHLLDSLSVDNLGHIICINGPDDKLQLCESQ